MQRFLFATLAILTIFLDVEAKVTVELEPQPITVKTDKYEARIEPDGCLTDFKVGGINYFAPGVGISRGSYFYLNGPLKLNQVERVNGNVVEASNDKAAIRYEFSDEQLTTRLTNRSDADMIFFVVLNGLVGAASSGEGKLQKTPLNGNYSRANFFIDSHRLEIEGFDTLWGPWEGPHQVVQVSLKPAEERTLILKPTDASEAEKLKILSFKAAPHEPDLTISSPRDYQVIQRYKQSSGRALFSGRTRTEASAIQIRITGEGLSDKWREWHAVPVQPETQKFSQWLVMPAGGWYKLEARAVSEDKTLAEAVVEHFGIGEVFVGAGQSNSTNCGQFKTTQTTGMVSSFSGTHWQIGDDPQPGVADRSQGGSFWPAFGDKMYRELGVPIGVATTGYGGTSVNQWQPDGDLFLRWFMTRIHQLGPQGFRAVLWHQGESDVHMPSDEYYAKLQNTILTSISQAGWEFPWFVAHASYHNSENPGFESVRSAQKKLWDEAIAEPGPDTDTLMGDHRDFEGKGIHFSPKGLKAHGEMWADKLLPYVKSELTSQAD